LNARLLAGLLMFNDKPVESMPKTTPNRNRLHPRLTYGLAALLCVCGLLSSCASKNKKNEAAPEKYQFLWPEPPDQPRFAFETMLRSPNDLRRETDEERFRRTVMGDNNEAKAFAKPASVAVRKGRAYVADPPSRSIVVFDAPGRKVFRFGRRPPHTLDRPISVGVDEQSMVYVLDAGHKKVLVFDELGLYKFSVGEPKDLVKPVGVAVSKDGQRIYVVDRGTVNDDDHKVIAYTPDGRELFRIGARGKGDGQLNIPLGAAVLPDGNLAVLDSGNFRIQIFNGDGKYVRSFGGVGTELGRFSRPRSIASDNEGNIYVADGNFNNVQIFNPAGQLLLSIGQIKLKDGPGHYGLISGIGVDETQRLYVIDNYFTKVEVFRRLSDQEGKAYLQKS
jgi:sugar lactone lactonase YvrE